MKAFYASLVIGSLFLILSFLVGDDAMDFDFNGSNYVIPHALILGVITFLMFMVSFFLYRKHKVKQ